MFFLSLLLFLFYYHHYFDYLVVQLRWTPWAVRRFLLYDVVLHELGHLQEINPGKKDWNRRFTAETKAEEFADYWRRTLFADDVFQHSDQVHFALCDEELAFLEVWALLDKPQRYEMVMR